MAKKSNAGVAKIPMYKCTFRRNFNKVCLFKVVASEEENWPPCLLPHLKAMLEEDRFHEWLYLSD
jgi:hypothetical protein